MGDSACLMHGFSYASDVPNESKQGNPVHALGESVSFGRFMTESLSWERWSTFSQKKYVDAAKRYAQPGSVAQKKAFFEAHYKRIASQKAAALLEQENAAKNATVAEESEVGYMDDNDDDETRLVSNSNFEVEDKSVEAKIQNSTKDDEVNCNGKSVVVEGRVFATVENEAKWDSPMRRNSSNKFDNFENHDNISASDGSGTSEMERLLLNRGYSVQVENESLVQRNSIQTNLGSQDTISGSESGGTPQVERPLLKQNSVASEDNPSVTSKKSSGPSLLKSSIQRKTWTVLSTPAKPVTPHLKKENSSVIRSTRKSNLDTIDRRRASPKSLRSIINLLHTKEPDKEPSSASKKAESSRIGLSSLRVPKDCATPLRTPLVGATKGVSKYPKATPRLESRRTISSFDHSASGCKTSGPKWHLLSSVCTKSLTACRNKLQSPTITTPFVLRTEERAAKRKQKLEETFNANKDVHKEKAENEFRKLSRSLCFKARPLPDFYNERETPKNQMKITPAAAQPQTSSSLLGKSIASKTHGNISMPTPAPTSLSMKAPKIRRILSNNSSPERMSHENKSPNIQLLL
ncbi:protein WVD2-like 7 isoform X2 [Primulina tabacum]|uniref:protein WVD2-like 7 isoform X2 n=1 Tax=Primulina tabacum TaxID=48773 RepID=UPI003F59A270